MKYYMLIIGMVLTLVSNAQVQTVVLWQGSIPNAIENPFYKEIQTVEDSVLKSVSQVKTPTLTIYQPNTSNGTAIVICPGGGYHHLAMDKEGFKVAEWLNTLGITAVVLKYRIPSDSIMKDKPIGPLQDVQEALRYVRRNALKYNLKNNKIGIMGFSAGGHLAASASTLYDESIYQHDTMSAKPDFSILVYPVISMKDAITHQGSKQNLLGNAPTKELIEHYSTETQIDSLTPKTFLVHATDDTSVHVENSIQYYLALKQHQVSVEMHLYEKGGHGFGLGREGMTSNSWTPQCRAWLKSNGFMD